MKILTVIGARPQFIKAASISRIIAKENDNAENNSCLKEVIVHTGQHYDHSMSDIFFNEMSIPSPGYRLNIIGRSHAAMTGEIMTLVERVLQKEAPDIVLTYGDTNTTLAAAIAACKIHIPVAHVEAGLRSYNKRMPEEINRILTDQVSSILFCPTQQAILNLLAEGFPNPLTDSDLNENRTFRFGEPPLVILSGDVMYDAAIFYAGSAHNKSKILKKHPVRSGNYILATIHRAENTDNSDMLRSLIFALSTIARKMPVLIPMHPRTRKLLSRHGITFSEKNVTIIEPVGYCDMIELVRNCKLVMTDSGGLQKEAYFFGKPCVTLRNETEWVELVENGHNLIAGCDPERICSCAAKQLKAPVISDKSLYGDGRASEKIVRFLSKIRFLK